MKSLTILVFFSLLLFLIFSVQELDGINIINLMECPDKCNLNGLCEMYFHKSTIRNKEEYIEQYSCKCFGSYVGESCGNCSFGHYGSKCLPCPGFENNKVCHGNGVCSEGINGTGKCICFPGYDVNLDCQLMRPLEEGFMLTNRKISFLILAALCCVFVIFALHYFPLLNILPKSLAAITVGFLIGLLIKLIIEESEYEESEIIPKAFFIILLPPIIFHEGFSLDKATFFKNIGTILLFAFCGTLISCLIFAIIIYFSSFLEIIKEISFVEAIMFGGLISCVDSELILFLFKKFNSNSSLNMLVYGENVLKESFSITIYRIFCTYVVGMLAESKDVHIPIFDLIYVFFGSILIGFVVAGTCSFALKILDFSAYPQIEIAFFILYCYIPYPICEGLGLSGIIGTLFASMIMNNFAFYSLSPINQISSTSVIKCSAFVTEEFCYVYLGIQLPSAFKGFSFSFLFISVVAMIIARAAEVYPLTNICNKFRQHKLESNHKFSMWFFALKGTIPFALAIGFPTSNNKLISSTTQLIILFSIIFLGGLSQIFIRCCNIFNIEELTSAEQREIPEPSSRQSQNTLTEDNVPRNLLAGNELSHGIKVFPGQSFREIILNNFWKIENFLRKNDWVKRKERATQMMAEADRDQ